jgi:tripartite-type tricarboxylate transporter receptor subunit TctC
MRPDKNNNPQGRLQENAHLEDLVQLGLDGTEITPGTPEDYADFIDKDEKKWSELVKASGVEQE